MLAEALEQIAAAKAVGRSRGMSQGASRKARFLKEHPLCCFCGGTRTATTLDHVPPKACFPLGFWPEEFEFPSCNLCNNGTSKRDTIFGFYSMLLDFNEDNRTHADRERLEKLRDEIARRYPDALPDPASREPIYRAGHIITPSPVAISVSTKPIEDPGRHRRLPLPILPLGLSTDRFWGYRHAGNFPCRPNVVRSSPRLFTDELLTGGRLADRDHLMTSSGTSTD
jgi:hypothetical protein